MRKTLEIARNDLRLFLVSRGNLIGLLLVPIIMTLVIGFVSGGFFGQGPSQVIVDVIDLDDSPQSAQMIDAFREANNSLVLCPMDNDSDDACELDEEKEIDRTRAITRVEEATALAAVEIPAGFGVALLSYQPVDIIYYSVEDFTAPGYIQQALGAAIQRVNGAVVASRVGLTVFQDLDELELSEEEQSLIQASLLSRAEEIWDRNPAQVSFELSGPESGGSVGEALQSGLGQSVPGMGSMFVMFTVFGGMTALITERKQWTLQRLAVTPTSKAQLLGGKILARFSLGILQYSVVFAVGAIVGMSFGRDPLALILLALSYTIAITALSFALGSWLKNESQASGFTLLLSLVLAPLGGAWWPLEIVPDFMQKIGHISPIAWAMDGFNALIFQQGNLADVLLPVVVLLGVSLVFFLLAVRFFKYD